MDIKIIIDTIKTVLKREGIELKELGNLDDYRVIQSTPTENKRV